MHMVIGTSQCSPFGHAGAFLLTGFSSVCEPLVVTPPSRKLPLKRDSESIRKLALVTICSPPFKPLSTATSSPARNLIPIFLGSKYPLPSERKTHASLPVSKTDRKSVV